MQSFSAIVLAIVIVSICINHCYCFKVSRINAITTANTNTNHLTMQFSNPMYKSICTGVLAITLSLQPISPAIAAVGEGDLPDGAMSFSKILKYQNDWLKLADAVKERGSSMDQKEILGIKVFLKQLANEYYDMELLASGIIDKETGIKAKSIAKDFRSKIRECDDALNNGNIEKISQIYPETSKELSDFLLLLQDVPDEL